MNTASTRITTVHIVCFLLVQGIAMVGCTTTAGSQPQAATELVICGAANAYRIRSSAPAAADRTDDLRDCASSAWSMNLDVKWPDQKSPSPTITLTNPYLGGHVSVYPSSYRDVAWSSTRQPDGRLDVLIVSGRDAKKGPATGNCDQTEPFTEAAIGCWAARSDIYLAEFGGELQRLSYQSGQVCRPSLSPDGKQIAFSEGDGCAIGASPAILRIRNVVSGNETTLEPITEMPAQGMAGMPIWSPDSNSIAYWALITKPDAEGPRNLLQVATRDQAGNYLVRTAKRLDYGGSAPLVWSADSHAIAFVEDNQLQIVNTNGITAQFDVRTTALGCGGRHDLGCQLSWSPDGKRLAVYGGAGVLDIIRSTDGAVTSASGLPRIPAQQMSAVWSSDSLYACIWSRSGPTTIYLFDAANSSFTNLVMLLPSIQVVSCMWP
jgi:hypothetical protein